MAALNAEGITVWLRYAHEMNGDWYAWGQQPQAFIASWEMMANTVHATAPDTCEPLGGVRATMFQ